MKFDFWTHWGAALTDAEFAAAWLALGVVAGTREPPSGPAGRSGAIEHDPSPPLATDPTALVGAAVSEVLLASGERTWAVRWRFPDPDDTVDVDGRVPLVQIDPTVWAKAWIEAAGAIAAQLRLRVMQAPQGEPHRPWLRLLAEAQPQVGAVSVAWRPANPQLALAWPLRLGTLAAAGEAVVGAALAEWPSSRLARRVPLDRDNANCDLLVHEGSAGVLLASLLALPYRCKANLIVITAASDAGSATIEPRLHSLAAEMCASGIVLMPQAADPHTVGLALNAFVEALSHDEPLDGALHAALRQPFGSNASLWLTDALADVHLQALADGVAARVRRLPSGTTIDVSRLDAGWVRSAPREISRAGSGVPIPSPGRVDAATVTFDADRLHFDAESHGASELAILTTAVADAQLPAEAEPRRAARFLQQQSFVRRGARLAGADGGFVVDKPARVRVRIGPHDTQWQALPTEFPAEALPPSEQQWRLTIWLTEPTQLAEPLRKTVLLPTDGPSTECEFHFTPRAVGAFEGRITVLHRGRVLQTAVLRGGVVGGEAEFDANASPALVDLVPIRHRLGDLEGRRQFDLAYVLNHTVAGEPRGVALAADHAWIADVTKSLEITKDLNTVLSRVAKSVVDYADGLAGEKGRALFVDLAKKGAWLDLYLVRNQLGRPTNRPDIAEREYIQIVSTRTDATVPFEFIYDHEVPDDDASVCAHWRDALSAGQCPDGCVGGSARQVCPLGFWGLRKVIERHQVTPELAAAGRELFLQSEPGRDTSDLPLGGTALVASSSRVPPATLATLTAALATKLGAAPQLATSWTDWATIVGQAKPHFLLALPHTGGTGANVTLEIGGSTLNTIQIKAAHVRPSNEPIRPLVALLGCDTAGTANDYGEHVAVFRERGAAIVIGTIATVFGEHAARVGMLLAQQLLPNGAPPQRLGEAIRTLKRQALLDGLLMPLCVVAYGDADWRLVRQRQHD